MNKKPQKQPKKITAGYLENAALFYLQRYATSVENLKDVLIRKINRSCAFHKTPPQEFYLIVDNLLERYKASGLLNDPALAKAKTSTLRRQGQSRKAIENKLQQKGLRRDDIAAAIAEVDESDTAELDAALAFVQRKKLGQGKRELQKELATMCRAGFSYEIAKQALKFREREII